MGKILWITKRAMRSLQIGAGFRDYKLGQEGLQIGPALGISNWSKDILNRGRDYKTGARGISNREMEWIYFFFLLAF